MAIEILAIGAFALLPACRRALRSSCGLECPVIDAIPALGLRWLARRQLCDGVLERGLFAGLACFGLRLRHEMRNQLSSNQLSLQLMIGILILFGHSYPREALRSHRFGDLHRSALFTY